jgi:hypothetical protein
MLTAGRASGATTAPGSRSVKAYRGAFEDRTRSGVPVYNVALLLLRALHPERPPFHVLNLAPPVEKV